ncbi:Crp/Fnr family transcriptional regulator [Fulvivirga sediminis]|uniref:Crp/Fnr family transcriptional regulator n=1 Tax=Fulvivirga sediminis TaxID=2803949 RepID=A0A937K200_9BACT|nr:Crp/Fnr family transcriptional regulator [Fulvivirga sediminis]MBL3657252.1 Crp/Fnr family transcriptional regulator [Fulvivirga sediminis]
MDEAKATILSTFQDICLSTEEEDLLLDRFRKKELNRGDHLFRAGHTVACQYFISKGCLRTYFIDDAGKQHTLQFAITDWWISDYTAFFSEDKATLNIECVQDAVVLEVSKTSMDELYRQIPKLEGFFRRKMERAFASFQKRILGNLALSAKQRYENFIHTYPEIEKSVKNYHIASYLGITTESLSRIRKEITKN